MERKLGFKDPRNKISPLSLSLLTYIYIYIYGPWAGPPIKTMCINCVVFLSGPSCPRKCKTAIVCFDCCQCCSCLVLLRIFYVHTRNGQLWLQFLQEWSSERLGIYGLLLLENLMASVSGSLSFSKESSPKELVPPDSIYLLQHVSFTVTGSRFSETGHPFSVLSFHAQRISSRSFLQPPQVNEPTLMKAL